MWSKVIYWETKQTPMDLWNNDKWHSNMSFSYLSVARSGFFFPPTFNQSVISNMVMVWYGMDIQHVICVGLYGFSFYYFFSFFFIVDCTFVLTLSGLEEITYI